MSNDFAHLVIRASAGSGKTYKLSERYLRLALAGTPISSILATTFTRKAAGEIQNRILERLGKGALGDENAAALSRELFGAPNRLTREKLLDLAVKVARSLDEIRVCTLDAFFMQIAGGFEFEIGLPPGWRIVEEEENRALMRRALQAAFAQVDARAAHELSKSLFRGESKRNVESQILRVVEQGLDVYRNAKSSAWTKLAESIPAAPSREECLQALLKAPLPKNKGKKSKKTDEEAAPSYNSHFVKSRRDLVKKLEENDMSSIFSTGLLKPIVSGNETFQKVQIEGELKKALEMIVLYALAQRLSKEAARLQALRKTLAATNRFYERLKRGDGAYRFEDITQTLANMEEQDQLRRVVYRLGAKTTCLLLDEFQDSSGKQWAIISPFARAITESTSDALDQNAEDFGSKLTSFFCVGDVKQAIYGWRGGDARIFEKMERSLPNLEKSPMDVNWRSCATIIDVVNDVFENLENNPVWTNDSASGDDDFDKQLAVQQAVKTWRGYYQRHSIAEKNASKLGWWSLEAAPVPCKEDESQVKEGVDPRFNDRSLRVNRFRDETEPSENLPIEAFNLADDLFDDDIEDSYEEEVNEENSSEEYGSKSEKVAKSRIEYAVKRIAELNRRYPNYSIGVLVRSNGTLAKIIRGLAALGVDASAEGGSLIVGSPVVVAALATVKLAAHPGDLVSAYRIATVDPLAARFKLNQKNYAASALNVSHEIREFIETRGLGKFVSEMRELLDPICDERDRERMRRFVEYSFGYETTSPRLQLDSYIAAVETAKRETPSNANIRVMTIHGSKGLEFDIVVLPELDASNNSRNLVFLESNSIYAGRDAQFKDDEFAKYDYVVDYVGKDERKVLPDEFRQIFIDGQRRRLEEALSVLYVALTRPVRALVAIVDGTPAKKSSDNKKGKEKSDRIEDPKISRKLDFAGILCQALAPNVKLLGYKEPYYGHAQILYEAGTPDWDRSDASAPLPSPEKSDSVAAQLVNAPTFTPTAARRVLLKRETPTQRRGVRVWTSPQTFSRGSALHACFELVEWLDRDGAPSDEDLRRVVAPIAREKREIDKIVAEFKGMLATPYVQSLLSLSTLDPRKTRPTSLFGDSARCAVLLDEEELAKLSDPQWVVYRERPFSFLDGGVILRGVIDRLTLIKDGDRVVAADVLDYKSNAIPEDATAPDLVANLSEGLREEYRRQLESYAKVVRTWFNLPKDKVSTRLAFLSYGTTIDPQVLNSKESTLS